ncbi:MAG: hypothetical protein JW969_13880 [Spirochaetales bacterium]|nr:hypothetical protein [Spirochaetales bacterium]
MSGQMDLEFSDNDSLAGFRLERIELYNWGTFHDKVWRLLPSGKNILVTGDIGTGKSTLIDAVTTLLVPAHHISYNKAAGAETRERTLRSYVQGYYKAERTELGYGAKPVALREKNSFSVILGVFTNEGFHQTVTLAQVFCQRDQTGQPDRFYIVADTGLSISEHFSDFGDEIRDLKKHLKSIHQVGKDGVFDSFPPYAAAFKRRFGIENDQALELFLQTVSMKTVGNLTDFVRTHMLEAFDIEPRIAALINHFDDLNRAHNAVLKAKAQISKLKPLREDLDSHAEVSAVREELRLCREGLKAYFAGLKFELLEKRITNIDGELHRIEARILQWNERHSHQQSERDGLRQAIAENGGDRLERLKVEIRDLTEKKQARLGKSGDYRTLMKKSGIPFDGSMDSFLKNREFLPAELERVTASEADFQNRMMEVNVDFEKLRSAHEEVVNELESLKKRKSNIDAFLIRVREQLCLGTGIGEKDIPFAGELLRVRPEDAPWEGAIERLLRNFGLSLLVPERHYGKVCRWVNKNNSRARIVYFKVSGKLFVNEVELHPESLVYKVEVKPGSEFSEWLGAEISRRFDYACCDDLDRFQREKFAVTRAGQIKGAGNRHEKDDRYDIADRKRYILGWSNEAKIASLNKRRLELEEEIADTAGKLSKLQDKQREASERKSLLIRLDGFQTWEELDYQPLAVRIEELERERKDLEAASNVLAELNTRLQKLEEEIRETNNRLDEEKDLRSRSNEKRAVAVQSMDQCRTDMLDADGWPDGFAVKLDTHRKSLLGGHVLSVESCDNRQHEMREKIQAKIDAEDKSLKRLEERIIRNMQDYRREYVAETTDVDARLESGNEFLDMLARLEQDDLPRFESRFKDLLNENTIREIANFQSNLHRERQSIKERIEKINESLSKIEYNKGRYIRLEIQESPDAEIRDFKQSLTACTEGTLTGSVDDQYAEAKFLQVRAIIDRFRGRENRTEADKRWTRKVTDVRNWHVFAASERWFEDHTEHEHYTDSGGKSGGQKEKLAYTVLAASLAYQFGLSWGEVKSRSFRFVAIDEAFGRGSDESARFGLELFKRLNLQLLIVTPLQKIHIIEPFVSSVGFVDCPDGRESRIRNLTIEEYRREKESASG